MNNVTKLLGFRVETKEGIVGQVIAVWLNGDVEVSNEKEQNQYHYPVNAEKELKVVYLPEGYHDLAR
jgi:hypothetical protein